MSKKTKMTMEHKTNGFFELMSGGHEIGGHEIGGDEYPSQLNGGSYQIEHSGGGVVYDLKTNYAKLEKTAELLTKLSALVKSVASELKHNQINGGVVSGTAHVPMIESRAGGATKVGGAKVKGGKIPYDKFMDRLDALLQDV